MSVDSVSPATRLRHTFRLDLPGAGGSPRLLRWIAASLVALFASLAACAAIARLTIAVDPALASYSHLGFGDYAKLEIIGVLAACLAWQVITRLSSRAWLPFLWLAILVTIVGLAPDVWILLQGQPVAGVGALVVMHLALAVVTYPALVFMAPQPRRPR